jgi:hypothetical protein
VGDTDWRREWDPQLKHATRVKDIDELTWIMHHEYMAKRCLTEVHRDFVVCTHRRNLRNGDVVVLSTSKLAPQGESEVPQPADCTRGFLYLAGYCLAQWAGEMVILGCSDVELE